MPGQRAAAIARGAAASQRRREADRRGPEDGLDAPAHLLRINSGLGGGAPDRLLAVEPLGLAAAHAPRYRGDSLLRCQRGSIHELFVLSDLASLRRQKIPSARACAQWGQPTFGCRSPANLSRVAPKRRPRT